MHENTEQIAEYGLNDVRRKGGMMKEHRMMRDSDMGPMHGGMMHEMMDETEKEKKIKIPRIFAILEYY
jgi:hypothetical protein